MAVKRFAELTWKELEQCDRSHLVAILPVGATEAHGPHLPLSTDVVIAEAMAERGAALLQESGTPAVVLPPLAYTAAAYADGFPGTVSIRPETVTAVIRDIAQGLAKAGLRGMVIANAHLDPTHIGSLRRASESEVAGDFRVVFPDITRKPWALRLTDEFKSGACHAGQFEGSIVMAARPDLVRNDIRERLPDNPASLSDAIRSGRTTFEEAGGPEAYFGYPARATAEEGRATIEALGRIVADAVREAWATEQSA